MINSKIACRSLALSGATLAGLLLAACGQSSSVSGDSSSAGGSASSQLPSGAYCVLQDPRLKVGSTPDLVLDGTAYTHSHQPDAPSPLELPLAKPGPQPTGACKSNKQYRFGAGLYETTGPIGGNPTGHADMFGMVVPPQVPNGIQMRLYARAFAFASPCNGKRVMFVSEELGAMSALVRQEVLAAVAADSTLSPNYGPGNIMLSATHTHTAPGGFGVQELPDLSSTLPLLLNNAVVWLETLIFSNADYDDDNVKAVVAGITQAIRRADANLQAHADTAPVRMAVSQLLNANVNRSPPAYQQDAASERAPYVDQNGHDVDVDKRFLQLNLVRGNGSAAGVLNWFAVHPTSMGNHDLLISSDNKGYAGQGFEHLMGTHYAPDADGKPDGKDNFVAAFAQTDEGDTVPDLFVFDADLSGGNGPGQGVPYFARGGTDEPYEFSQPGYPRGQPESAAINGTKQLAEALTDYTKGTDLSGPVDYRYFNADYSADVITDPQVLATLQASGSPDDLYTGAKTTCGTAMGIDFAAGGVNGPGFGAAGFACKADAPSAYKDEVRKSYNGLFNGTGYVTLEKNDKPLTVPFDGVAVLTVLAPTLCLTQNKEPQYDCQAEKPVILSSEVHPVPIQIFRIGNLAILGVPFEVTTMAGRRLRQSVLDALSPVGVDTVVIAGLSNDYLHYMTTREEYSAQMYEGSSTTAGPWQLAATQQEARKAALAMAAGQPDPTGLPDQVQSAGPASPVTLDSPSNFGTVVTDAAKQYTQGDTVDVSFVSGYPGNDTRAMQGYFYAEKQNSKGGWDVVATDGQPQLTFLWNSSPSLIDTELGRSGASTAEGLWKIPLNTAAGTYRLRHEGVDRLSSSAPAQPYEGLSSPFQIVGTAAACP